MKITIIAPQPLMEPEFGRFEGFLRGVVTTACAYEVVALTTRRLPSVSCLARQSPATGALVLAGLAVHFSHKPTVVTFKE